MNYTSNKPETHEKLRDTGLAILGLGALAFSAWVLSYDSEVNATVDSPDGSMTAYVPYNNGDTITPVELRNGTDVTIDCKTGMYGSQFQGTIDSGVHAGDLAVLFDAVDTAELDIKSDPVFPLEAC